jgi:SRSO17 transposase
VAVTLTYATSHGHALIGRALYLPEASAGDEEHRELAGIPEEVMFATKPQLADALLDRAHRLGIRAAFVAGDEVYGGRELRRGIRRRGVGYVMAVRASRTMTVGAGRTLTAAEAVPLIPARAWHRMRTGSGNKGTRHYDWPMLEVTSDDTPDGHAEGHSVLPARRHRYTGKLSFCRCWTPGPVPLSRLIAIAVTRWRIEEIISWLSRPLAWTLGRSSAGSPGIAGPHSACSPTSTWPWPPPCTASKTPAQTWTPG